ncbi:MAG: diversity-generating retroelement protein Avd [Anaerolineae bacterium]|nr:diversity-generating retroelement protein Avd [Anaerolineae bacterium]
MKESPIFTKSYELLRWLIPLTLKFPREQRFVVAEAVQRTALQFHERLIEAAKTDGDPRPVLKQADVDLTRLRFYVRLCRDFQLISLKQYGHAAQLLAEVGRLLGGWMNPKKERPPKP